MDMGGSVALGLNTRGLPLCFAGLSVAVQTYLGFFAVNPTNACHGYQWYASDILGLAVS